MIRRDSGGPKRPYRSEGSDRPEPKRYSRSDSGDRPDRQRFSRPDSGDRPSRPRWEDRDDRPARTPRPVGDFRNLREWAAVLELATAVFRTTEGLGDSVPIAAMQKAATDMCCSLASGYTSGGRYDRCKGLASELGAAIDLARELNLLAPQAGMTLKEKAKETAEALNSLPAMPPRTFGGPPRKPPMRRFSSRPPKD